MNSDDINSIYPLTIGEQMKMWQDRCGKLAIELQNEQQKRIWFQTRYEELISALRTLSGMISEIPPT